MVDTKRVIGPGPKPSTGLVGINLTTAGHLADALDRVARGLDGHARTALAAGARGGLVPAGPARLGAVAGWAQEEASSLRALIRHLSSAEDHLVARWAGGRSRAFALPARSYAVAQQILAALDAGDHRQARRLFDVAAADPVVATVVIGALGAHGVVGLLRPAVQQWALAGAAGDTQRAVIDRLAEALARAARHGTTSIGMADLAREADRHEVPRAALALLFVGGARFPVAFLREAVTAVVAPINASVRADVGIGLDRWIIPAAGAPLDARVLILRAAARDHRAATEAVGAVDLDDLLPASLGYLDGGVALARLLRAATTPVDARGALLDRPLVTTTAVAPGRAGENARRVIEWIGAHREVPLGVQVELGRLARPWIGSFRTAGLDGTVHRHIHLDEERARAYLVYAQARGGVDRHLQEAAWRWAGAEVRWLSGPRFTGAGFDAVGSVLGIVTVTGLDADAARASGADQRASRQNALWRSVTGLVEARLPSPVRRLVDPVTGRGLDRVLARTDREIEHWRDLRDLAVVHEYLALDYLVAATLWTRRVDNGYLSDPPPSLLADPTRPALGLRLPVGLDGAGAVAWMRWRSAQADGGPAPLQSAGDQFLLDSRS